MIMSIVVKKGDLTKISCDAIINPANSYGYMGGGATGAIKREGGEEIEKEAFLKAPITVGTAIFTKAGKLSCKFIIHAPTMKQPAQTINIKNVKLATRAALELGVKLHLQSIAIPGMGTGVGGVDVNSAAETIVQIAKEYNSKFKEIVLLDRNDEMINAFKKKLY